jgi:hypothetical protein
MFMICLGTKFDIPGSSGQLFVAVITKTKYRFRAAVILVFSIPLDHDHITSLIHFQAHLKLSLFLTKHHAMKTYGGVDLYLHAFFT